MEGSESEVVFGAFDLNPQLFLNEVLNAVDGKSDSAFDLCLQQATEIVRGGADRSEELVRGVSSLQYLMKGVLDKRMSMWEKYCLQTCFSVPDGFVLPNSKESVVTLLRECCPDDELDSEIYSLRNKLAAAGREFNGLGREMSLLEQKSTASKNFNATVAEVQHMLEEPSVHHMFQELAETASKLQKKVAEMHRERSNNMKMPSFSSQENHMVPYKGLPAKIEDIQEIVSILNTQS
ncbi:protein MIS12 homolog [Zingiber officinale]|uniref:protein MIS12 homolog n=1 Tax=Zingiber officinale TaxID=94328 RepID=UPI001C4BAE51|nr:protein MIS12 homolog [Zingiber officinale]